MIENKYIIAVLIFGWLTVMSHGQVVPIIISPATDLEVRLTDLTARINYHLTLECKANGSPQPTIAWTSNVYDANRFTNGNFLMLEAGDLELIGLTNPIIFNCTAENILGVDYKTVKILTKIDMVPMIDSIEDVNDEIISHMTDIITMNTNGVDTSSENALMNQEELYSNVKDFETVMTMYILNTTMSEENIKAVEHLLTTAQTIIEKDSEILIGGEEMDIFGVVSLSMSTTLNLLEDLSFDAANDLLSSDNLTHLSFNTTDVFVSAQLMESEIENILFEDRGRNLAARISLPDILTGNIENSIPVGSVFIFQNITKNAIDIFSMTTPFSDLPGKVEITFRNPEGDQNKLEPECVFFDGTQDSWSSDGLNTIQSGNETICSAEHLTSFTVFNKPRKRGNDDLRRIASIVSYAVVSISFLALIGSLILFIISGKTFFKIEANIVYFNYCLSLTLAFGLFLFGIETGTFNVILCKVIAFLLHYLWLSVFVWTLCNGILILYKLTLDVLIQRKIYPYLIVFGWSFPIIIPIITVSIKYETYVNEKEHCFLTYEDGTIWAFIGPIIGIILINTVILIVSVICIPNVKFRSENMQKKHVIKSELISTSILTLLLGIPWIILILNLFIPNFIVWSSFILSNGLIGVFFFLVVTLRNTEVKNFLKSRMKKKAYSQVSIKAESQSTELNKKFKQSDSRETTEISHIVKTDITTMDHDLSKPEQDSPAFGEIREDTFKEHGILSDDRTSQPFPEERLMGVEEKKVH